MDGVEYIDVVGVDPDDVSEGVYADVSAALEESQYNRVDKDLFDCVLTIDVTLDDGAEILAEVEVDDNRGGSYAPADCVSFYDDLKSQYDTDFVSGDEL